MNKNNLNKIIEQYIANFEKLNAPADQGGDDEGYKWRVISAFKEHWDIDAPDFCDMFCKAMDAIGKTNLINNAYVLPLQGIIRLMTEHHEVEFVRQQFRLLYSEDDGDIDARGERVFAFRDNMNAKIEEKFPGSWKFPQNTFCCIFYLSLWRPEDNYIYRATEAREWADCIEFADDFGSGASFSLKKYYRMCDELRESLQDYPELLDLHQGRFDREARGFDDQLHLLAFDIIFCSHYMGFYRECPTLGVSTKERVRIAKRREEEERLEAEIQAKQEEITRLEDEVRELPDLVGKSVKHKRYGDGKIESFNNGIYLVSFPEKQSKFNEDAIAKGFLGLSDDSIAEIASDNLAIKDIIRRKGMELAALMRELENL